MLTDVRVAYVLNIFRMPNANCDWQEHYITEVSPPLPGLKDIIRIVSLSRSIKQLIGSVGFCCPGLLQPNGALSC